MTIDMQNDLVIKYQNEHVYSPVKVSSSAGDDGLGEDPVDGEIVFTISNMSERTYEDIGIYVQPSANLGALSQPATFVPETDYHDLIAWGERSSASVDNIQGGLTISFLETSEIVRKDLGTKWSNRVVVGDIAGNTTIEVTASFKTPSDTTARRLFISIVVG